MLCYKFQLMMIKDATVLIVDDNFDFHTVATAVLEQTGYHVRSLYEGPGKYVCKFAADCDLILLDVDLPGDSGIDICRQLKTDPQCTRIPVILITGNADIDVLFIQSGADVCLSKPFSSTVLLKEVERLLTPQQFN
jgi:two-component system, OmpR family, alkaline phosphatase synthesis response regulator PhoP